MPRGEDLSELEVTLDLDGVYLFELYSFLIFTKILVYSVDILYFGLFLSQLNTLASRHVRLGRRRGVSGLLVEAIGGE